MQVWGMRCTKCSAFVLTTAEVKQILEKVVHCLPSKWCRWGPGYPLLIYHSHSHLYNLCVTWWRNLQSVFIQTVVLASIQMVFFTCMPTKPNKQMIFFSLFFNYGVICQEEKVHCFSLRHSKDLAKLCSISQDMPEHIMHPHLSLTLSGSN